MLSLNIGSGQRKFGRGWTNIDCQSRWTPDVLARGEILPFPNESASVVVLHHVLEHYGCGEGVDLLQECRRVLRPHGSMLVFVPDMHILCEWWMSGKLDNQLYMTNVYGAYMGNEADRHKWGYSFLSLSSLLTSMGFRKVTRFNWRSIPGSNIARDVWILGVEAVK